MAIKLDQLKEKIHQPDVFTYTQLSISALDLLILISLAEAAKDWMVYQTDDSLSDQRNDVHLAGEADRAGENLYIACERAFD